MPVQVISKACKMCNRLKIVIESDYHGAEIVDRVLECGNYDDCLLAVEMHEKGLEPEK